MYVIDHLSVSQVNTFSRCEYQWYHRYVEGLVIPPSSALIRGKAVHAGLSDIYTSIQNNGNYNPAATYELISAYIDHSDETEEINWDKPKGTIKDISVNLVKKYVEYRYPDSVKAEDIVDVEKKITYSLYSKSGEKVDIVGYPDVVLKNRILDFKTKNRKPSGIETEYIFQTALYSTVLKKDKAELQYLIATKSPQVITKHANIDNEIKASVRILFTKVYHRIKAALISGNFLPTGIFHPWACKFCGYGEQGKCLYYMKKAS